MEIKFYGAFELILRANLHAIDAPPARWRDDAGSLPLVHPTHWLISTQVAAHLRSGTPVACLATDGGGRDWGRLGYEVERAADVTPGTTKRGKASFDGAATCYLLRVR